MASTPDPDCISSLRQVVEHVDWLRDQLEIAQSQLAELSIKQQVVSIDLPKSVRDAAQRALEGWASPEDAMLMAKFIDGIIQ